MLNKDRLGGMQECVYAQLIHWRNNTDTPGMLIQGS